MFRQFTSFTKMKCFFLRFLRKGTWKTGDFLGGEGNLEPAIETVFKLLESFGAM